MAGNVRTGGKEMMNRIAMGIRNPNFRLRKGEDEGGNDTLGERQTFSSSFRQESTILRFACRIRQ